MAEEPHKEEELAPAEEPEETPGYKPPAKKTLDEIQNLDQDDESLVRYKQQLLKGTEGAGGRFNCFVVSEILQIFA